MKSDFGSDQDEPYDFRDDNTTITYERMIYITSAGRRKFSSCRQLVLGNEMPE